MQTPKTLRRVVVTGIGCVTPIGIGKEQFWQSVREGRSGAARITRFEPDDLPVQIAAEVKNFDPDQFIPPKDRQHVSHAVAYAIASAELAFAGHLQCQTSSGPGTNRRTLAEGTAAGR